MKRLIFTVTTAFAACILLAACAAGNAKTPEADNTGGFSTEIEVAAATENSKKDQASDDSSASDAIPEQSEINGTASGKDAKSGTTSNSPTSPAPDAKTKGATSTGGASAGQTGSSSVQGSSSKAAGSSSAAGNSSKGSSNTASSKASSSKSNSNTTSSKAASSKASSSKSSIGSIGTFTMTDLAGNTANQSILNNYELTMINVWATYCNPCISEIPDIDKVYKQFKADGVNIIGVALDGPGNTAGIQSVVNKTGASYKMYIPSSSMLSNSFMSNVTFVPTTFFADRDGNLVGSPVSGSRTAAAWTKIINERLAQARS